jgi:beta-aspartyl-peptidase (threonine type)
VLDETGHVLLAGEGAVRFALRHGFSPVELSSMITDHARARWEAARAAQANQVSQGANQMTQARSGGTVGAVAKDTQGHLAAATSTGGMVNKLAGRVGDSPILGAGTYADDTSAACSTTGHGEAMMRVCLAKTAIEAVRSLGPNKEGSAEEAARTSLAMMRQRTGETGGAIIATRDGSLGLARTTRTMSWAAVADDGDSASGW